MTGLAIVLIVVGSMLGMGIERNQQKKTEQAKTEQAATVNTGTTDAE